MCPGVRTKNNMRSNQPQAFLGGLTTMFLSPSGPCSIFGIITAFLSYCINTGYHQERFRGKLSLVYWFLNKNATYLVVYDQPCDSQLVYESWDDHNVREKKNCVQLSSF